MSTLWQKIFQGVVATEENLLPIFVTSKEGQAIAGAILVTETIFGSIFGLTAAPAAPVAPVATT